jgi:hypothetical protein
MEVISEIAGCRLETIGLATTFVDDVLASCRRGTALLVELEIRWPIPPIARLRLWPNAEPAFTVVAAECAVDMAASAAAWANAEPVLTAASPASVSTIEVRRITGTPVPPRKLASILLATRTHFKLRDDSRQKSVFRRQRP